MEKNTSNGNKARREFVKKLAYVAPAVITLAAAPAFAAPASNKDMRTPMPYRIG
jgi:hypothetical protein